MSVPSDIPGAAAAAFRSEVLRDRERTLLRLCFAVGALFHVGSLALEPIYVLPVVLPALRATHMAALGLALVWLVGFRKRHVASLVALAVTALLTLGCLAWALATDIALHPTDQVKSWIGLLLVGLFCLMYMPTHALAPPLVFAAGLAGTSAVLWSRAPGGWKVAVVGALLIHAAAAFRVAMIRRSRRSADLEARAMVAKLAAARAGYDRELELAQQIHASFGNATDLTLGPYRVRSEVARADAVGGDWYAARTEPGGRHLIVTVDAAGKGLQAALVLHGVQSLWAGIPDDERLDVAAWMEDVNATVRTMSRKTPHTASVSVLELRPDELRYWSAGHPPALVVRGAGSGPVEALAARGPVVGTVERLGLVPATARLAPGERPTLLLGTNGAFAAGTMRSPRRIRAIAAAGARPAAAANDDTLLLVISEAA